jgi:competence protein ComEC
VRDDTPAALPLIAFAAGLLSGATLREAVGFLLIALLLAAMRHVRAGLVVAFLAAGIFVDRTDDARRAREAAAVLALDDELFVTLEAPLDRDWSPRSDGRVQMLRVTRFVASQGHRRVEVADECRLYARFEPPPFAMERTIRAEGFLRRGEHETYTLTIKSPELLHYDGELSRWSPARWNRALSRRLRPFATTYPTEVALIEALVLGRDERLGDDVRDEFKRGGTYHLLVFSGLQIALAAAAIAALLRWLYAPRVSDWLLLAFAIVAPLFIGPTASVSRASIAIGLYAIARIIRRPTSLENLWCLAALVRLLVEPRDLYDAGFQLTFAGAGALLFAGKHLLARRWIGHAVAAELAVTPLTLFHFRQYALGGSLATIVMTPLVFAMLVIGALACVWPTTPLFVLIGLLHRACGVINEAGAHASGFFAAPPLVTMIVAFGGSTIAIATLRERRRAFAIASLMLIPLAAAMLRRDRVDDFRVTMLDVGQGDAILLRDSGHAILVDGGGRTDDFRFGETRLLPLLVDRGVRRLDAVVLTHAHPDHCGGLPAVLRHLEVRELWLSPRRLRGECAARLLAASHRTTIRLLRSDRKLRVGEMSIDAFVPRRTLKRAPDNNASLVLRVRAAMRTILLTGDVERHGELDLIDRDVRADILKVAHHGSRSSTTKPLLAAVQPRLALISCGRRNLFGHPHPAVIEALRVQHIRTWRTDSSGTIDVDIDAGRIRVRPQIDTPP